MPILLYRIMRLFFQASTKGYLRIVNRLLRDPRVNPEFNDNRSIIAASTYGHLYVIRRLQELMFSLKMD